MLLLGAPDDMTKFYMADADVAFKLHQMGCIPMYKDDDCLYFKINNKLKKALKKIDIDI